MMVSSSHHFNTDLCDSVDDISVPTSTWSDERNEMSDDKSPWKQHLIDLSLKRPVDQGQDNRPNANTKSAINLSKSLKAETDTCHRVNMNNFEQMSSPRKIDHLSFGMERLLAGKSKAEQIEPSSRQPDPNSLSPHTEMSYPPISLASSLLATTGESSLSQIQRAMGIYSIPHNHQSLINAGLPFRHLQGTLMNPSHQYLQGLYSSHPLFMSLRAPGPFHNPSGLNFHSGLQPHLLAATMGTGKRKKSWTRAVFSHLQRKGLERRFLLQKYITKPDRRQLAASLGLTDAQVKVWFQNRRMKWRHQETKQRRDQERAAAAANVNGSTGSIQQPLIGSSPSINPGHTHLEHQMENGDMESPPESPISSDMESDCADSNQVDSSNEEIKVD